MYQTTRIKELTIARKHISEVPQVKLSYSSKVKAADRVQVNSSKIAYEVLKESWDESTIELFESMKIIFLNRGNRILGIMNHSSGGSAGCIVDVKLIFQAALLSSAHAIILAHSHPSGTLKPSNEDLKITQKVKNAGILFEISVLDHLILSPYDGYFSLADDGLI